MNVNTSRATTSTISSLAKYVAQGLRCTSTKASFLVTSIFSSHRIAETGCRQIGSQQTGNIIILRPASWSCSNFPARSVHDTAGKIHIVWVQMLVRQETCSDFIRLHVVLIAT